LCDALNASQPNVSRHLAALRRAGLVRARRDGKRANYSVVPAQTGLPLSVLNQVRAMRADVAELSADIQRLRVVRQRLRRET
jgi:ArsR family transcriptional regulator